MNILLVDDELPSLEELTDAVSAVLASARILSFSQASKAIECAYETPIDIAFLDINMRFMDGITVAKKLLELYPSCNIVFCTGYDKYALDALDIYCSAYLLKPVSPEKVQSAIEHLRYPIAVPRHRVELKCFGNFDVLCDGKPIAFKYKKTRELLAYLVDRNGAGTSTQEIISAIFEENKSSYFSNMRLDLLDTFASLGVSDVLVTAYGRMSICRDRVDCDYFDYLDGKNMAFHGEYMSQYSFAEATLATLNAWSGHPHLMGKGN